MSYSTLFIICSASLGFFAGLFYGPIGILATIPISILLSVSGAILDKGKIEMGVSNTAILVFGVDLGEELPEFLEDFGSDFDEYLNSLSGLPSYGEEGHDFSAQREFRDKQIVDLVMYCSYDYPMYILALRDTEINGYRGNGKTIDPSTDFNIEPDRLEEFKTWLTDHGIEGEPKWYLDTING